MSSVVLIRFKDANLAPARLDKDDALSLLQDFVDSRSVNLEGFPYHASGHSCFAVFLPNDFNQLIRQRNFTLGGQQVGAVRKLEIVA